MPSTITFHYLIAPDGFGNLGENGRYWRREGFDGKSGKKTGKGGVTKRVTGRKHFTTRTDADAFVVDVVDAQASEIVLESTEQSISYSVLLEECSLMKGEVQRVTVGGAVSGDWMVEFSMSISRVP